MRFVLRVGIDSDAGDGCGLDSNKTGSQAKEPGKGGLNSVLNQQKKLITAKKVGWLSVSIFRYHMDE